MTILLFLLYPGGDHCHDRDPSSETACPTPGTERGLMTGGFLGRRLSSLIRLIFFLKLLLCQPRSFAASCVGTFDCIPAVQIPAHMGPIIPGQIGTLVRLVILPN